MPLATLHAFSVQQRTTTIVFETREVATADASAIEVSTGLLPMAQARSARPHPPHFRLRIELQRGWVHGLSVVADPPQVEQHPPSATELLAREGALLSAIAPSLPASADGPRRLAALLAEGLRAGLVQIPQEDPVGSAPLGRSSARRAALTPFHPLSVLRATIAQLLAHAGADRLASADALLDPMTRPRLALRSALHPSGLDPDEYVAAQLLSAPSHWDELLLRSRCPAPRLLRLLRDAAVLGVLDTDGADDLPARLLAVLVTPALAPSAEATADAEAMRRRSYHAQARAVHPDLRPEADEEERRTRTQAMAELAARHRRRD